MLFGLYTAQNTQLEELYHRMAALERERVELIAANDYDSVHDEDEMRDADDAGNKNPVDDLAEDVTWLEGVDEQHKSTTEDSPISAGDVNNNDESQPSSSAVNLVSSDSSPVGMGPTHVHDDAPAEVRSAPSRSSGSGSAGVPGRVPRRVVVLKRNRHSNFGLKIKQTAQQGLRNDRRSVQEDRDDDYPFVSNTADGAYAAGLRDGDLVVAIDGVSTLGCPLTDIFNQLARGCGDIRLEVQTRVTDAVRPSGPASVKRHGAVVPEVRNASFDRCTLLVQMHAKEPSTRLHLLVPCV